MKIYTIFYSFVTLLELCKQLSSLRFILDFSFSFSSSFSFFFFSFSFSSSSFYFRAVYLLACSGLIVRSSSSSSSSSSFFGL